MQHEQAAICKLGRVLSPETDPAGLLLFQRLNPAMPAVYPLDFHLCEPVIWSFIQELVVAFLSLYSEKVLTNSPTLKNN